MIFQRTQYLILIGGGKIGVAFRNHLVTSKQYSSAPAPMLLQVSNKPSSGSSYNTMGFSCATIFANFQIIFQIMISLILLVNIFAICTTMKIIPTFTLWNYLFLLFITTLLPISLIFYSYFNDVSPSINTFYFHFMMIYFISSKNLTQLCKTVIFCVIEMVIEKT